MVKFIKGDVVVINFPFTDLSQTKKRPALVINDLDGSQDIILCMITSQPHCPNYQIQFGTSDMSSGKIINNPSYIMPHKLFTAFKDNIIKNAGHIKQTKLNEVITTLKELVEK